MLEWAKVDPDDEDADPLGAESEVRQIGAKMARYFTSDGGGK